MALIGAGVLSSLVLSGCAQPTFNAQKLQRQLVQAGATPEQAQCVTTSLENSFDTNQLASHSDPTPTEVDKVHQLLLLCKVKLTPPPS